VAIAAFMSPAGELAVLCGGRLHRYVGSIEELINDFPDIPVLPWQSR
jgi:hypothetical protein